MVNIKQRLKSITPSPVWEFIRTRKGAFLDSVFNLGASVCTTTYRGFTIYHDRGNALIDRLRHEKYYEKELCEHIISDLKYSKNPCCIDIGANLGLISLSVLSEIPDIKIFAFEPGPAQREFLKKTITHNKLEKKISVNGSALGREEGTAKFVLHKTSDAAKDGFLDTGRGSHTTEIEIPVLTLDGWWQKEEKPHVDVVKIDTEGAELWVLEGGKHFVSLNKPVIYLEIEPRNLRVYPYTEHDILKFFESISYKLSTLSGVTCSGKNITELLSKHDTYRATPRT